MAPNDIQTTGLKPTQSRAIAALVATGDAGIAARSAGVSERTVRRWLAHASFRAELRKAEVEAVRSAARRLGLLADKALSVLEDVLDDSRAAHTPRIRAARTVLDLCLKWREQVELEERIRALEHRVGDRR